ncbi:MAG TPA: DUF4173 domain-containing protein [Pyrinomonadaceae bacterium]|nr:DUF4173 domain-containing protein [Pyrinomonadaceae bacterium]
MNERTKTGLGILEAALLLGILGDALLRATPWGLNLFLWIGALVVAMIALTFRHGRGLWQKENLWLHSALIVFAALFVWRDSLTLQVLDVAILLVLLSILTLPALRIQTRFAGFLQYAFGAVSAGLNAAFAPLLLIFKDIEWKTIPRNGWTRNLIPVLRGLAIAAPILLLFGGLFMAADAVFEGIVKNTFNINPETLFSHLLLFGFLAWITSGYLRGALLENPFAANSANVAHAAPQILHLSEPRSVVGENSEPPDTPKAETEVAADDSFGGSFFTLGKIEIGVVLGLINLLFLFFVIIQIRYFFGGMDLVQATPDFKLAEYARRGFFELCWVAGLSLPILLTAHWLLRKDGNGTEKLFRVLAGMQIALLFVIMFSAVQRMLLYTGSLGYGLTTMRLYPTAFVLWLALVFLWFGLTVLRSQPRLFAWGALWTALLVVGGLHVLNPDDLVVRHNVKLMQQGRQFDVLYNSYSLSDDAIPALDESISKMSFDDVCVVKHQLLKRFENSKGGDFRTFNVSRWIARRTFFVNNDGVLRSDREAVFDTTGCPAWTQKNHRYHDDF